MSLVVVGPHRGGEGISDKVMGRVFYIKVENSHISTVIKFVSPTGILATPTGYIMICYLLQLGCFTWQG